MSVGIERGDLAPNVIGWTLDRPERRNAVAPAALEWIASRCSELRGEVVVLRGAGDASFCAGFDLKALAEATVRPGSPAAPDEVLIAATQAMRAADATFVAAINGYALGAGVELLSACDFRLAVPEAWFEIPAAKLGVVYHAAGLARIRAAFGSQWTRRLLLSATRVTAAQLEAAGGCELVAAEALDAEAVALGRRISALAPLSVAGNRAMLRQLEEGRVPAEALATHERARKQAYASEDLMEATAALAEGRAPQFRGR